MKHPLLQRAIFRPFCMHHCKYCIMDHYSMIGKLKNEVRKKLNKTYLYNTKLTSLEIEPFFLAMIPEDLEAKKHILVHNMLEQIYTLFHENAENGKKLVKKTYIRTNIRQIM